MWHITSQKSGVSALDLKRELGLGSYQTAWLMLHKLRQAMVRPATDRLRGVVEMDETYWGSKESGGATGRLTYNKALIAVAAQADGEGIGRIRMGTIGDFNRATLHGFISANIEAGSTVLTDGLNSYRNMVGYHHEPHVHVRAAYVNTTISLLSHVEAFLPDFPFFVPSIGVQTKQGVHHDQRKDNTQSQAS